jgi:hypothetical protein
VNLRFFGACIVVSALAALVVPIAIAVWDGFSPWSEARAALQEEFAGAKAVCLTASYQSFGSDWRRTRSFLVFPTASTPLSGVTVSQERSGTIQLQPAWQTIRSILVAIAVGLPVSWWYALRFWLRGRRAPVFRRPLSPFAPAA